MPVDRRKFIKGAGSSGIVFGLAGCSQIGIGNGGGSGNGNAITFGGTVSESGSLSASGEGVRDGYRIWRDYMNNEHGGIEVGGQSRPIELNLYDDESSQERLVNLYNRLIDQDGVDLLLGPYSSGLSLSAVPIAERNNVPLVAPTVTLLSAYNSENMFGTFPPNTVYFPTMLEPVLNLDDPPSRAALVTADDPGHNAAAEEIRSTLADSSTELVMDQTVDTRPSDLSAEITEAKSQNTDLFIGEMYTQGATAAVQAAQTQDYSPDMMTFASGPSNPAFIDNLESAANGWVAPAPYHSDIQREGPYFESNENYIEKSQEYLDRTPGSIAYPMATAAGLAYQRAIENAGSADPSDVLEALDQVDMETVVGSIRFEDEGDVLNANLNADVYVVQIQDESIEVVYPEEYIPEGNSFEYPATPWSDR